MYEKVHQALIDKREISGEETLAQLRRLRKSPDECDAFLTSLTAQAVTEGIDTIEGKRKLPPDLQKYLKDSRPYEMPSHQFQVSVPDYLDCLRGLSSKTLERVFSKIQGSREMLSFFKRVFLELRPYLHSESEI